MAMALRFEVFSVDLDSTLDFYSRVLGFRVVRDERDAAVPYLFLERDGVRVGAVGHAAPANPLMRRPPVGVELVLEVDDVRLERERVAASRWPLLEDLVERPWGLTDFRLLDADGYLLRITSR